jgi:hypothetical protein
MIITNTIVSARSELKSAGKECFSLLNNRGLPLLISLPSTTASTPWPVIALKVFCFLEF